MGSFFSNLYIRLLLNSRAVVLRLEPSIIYFVSIVFTSPSSGNTFIQYSIWDWKDDRRDIALVLSCQFPFIPSCVIVFSSAVSATYDSFFSHACSSWNSGAIVAGTLVRASIVSCVGSKYFSAFTQDTAIF